MYIHPRRIKERLFAQYKSVHAKSLSDDEDESVTVPGEHETIFTNLSERDSFIETTNFLVPVIKPYKSLERLPSTIDHSDEFQMIPTMIRSTRSCSNLATDTTLRFDTNYAFTLDETKHQIEARKTIQTEPTASIPIPINESQIMSSESVEIFDIKEPSLQPTIDEKSGEFKYFRKTNRSTQYDQAVAAGRPFMSNGRLRAARRARKDVRFWERIDAIVALASAPPSTHLSRRHSFHEAIFYERYHPHIIKQQFRERRISLERDKQNFDEIVKTKYKYDETRVKSDGKRLLNEFEWTRELWYKWLDEYSSNIC
jgi:hypothetical protein